MKKFTVLMVMAMLLGFGSATLPTYAADPAPAPAPSDEKDKKNPSGPKVFENEKKDEKKDDKGGK